ncbi:MAG: hypothetical protein WBB68_02010 [Candidatus Moraniibacteriota bacterium]
MSTETVTPATLKQGKQTLNLIGQQDPSVEDMNTLHAGYLTYLMRAIKEGVVPPPDQFHAMIGLGPLYKTDKHGRILVTLTGRGWTNEEWFKHGEAVGMNFTKWARDILGKPDYNEKHRLEPGKQYTVALLFGKKEFDTDVERTTANLRARGERDYGKSDDLRGELALLIREAISDEQLERWGIYYIAVLHEPILVSGGSPGILGSHRFDDGQQVVAFYAGPGFSWGGGGAFAFPVSQ